MAEIGIVGGGIAGLYTALYLKQRGYNIILFEASNRVGGRIHSHHFGPLVENEDPFFEAGAMRVPLSSLHSCVFQLISYLNDHSKEEDGIQLIPFTIQHPNNKIYLQGKMWDCQDTSIPAALGLPSRYHNKTAHRILLDAIDPWLKLLWDDFERGVQEILRYDDMSFRHYLRTVVLWPHEVIDFVEVVMSQTNQYDLSFTDMMLQTMHFNTPDWVTVKGGLSRITASAVSVLGRDCVVRNAPVTEIAEASSGKIKLTVGGFAPQKRICNKVILALPAVAIQNIRVRPKWSPLKESAIRSLHEGPLYKMGLHFRTRFWENTSSPCFGGQTATDLRVRWIVYPSNDQGSSQSGCLMVYSGMTDALRWSWMTRRERIRLVLEDLDNFFSKLGANVYEHFVDAFDVNWPSEQSAGNTMYLPGQFSKFHDIMKQPEGNILFAGEHLSRHHTWIAGAIESAHLAVTQLVDEGELPVLGADRIPPIAPVQFGAHVTGKVPIVFDETKVPAKLQADAMEAAVVDAVSKLQSTFETQLTSAPTVGETDLVPPAPIGMKTDNRYHNTSCSTHRK